VATTRFLYLHANSTAVEYDRVDGLAGPSGTWEKFYGIKANPFTERVLP
jgi:hypothetical protein